MAAVLFPKKSPDSALGDSDKAWVIVCVPESVSIGDQDQVTLIVASRADLMVQDAVAAVIIFRDGEPKGRRLHPTLVILVSP